MMIVLTMMVLFGCSSKNTTGRDDCGDAGPCPAGSVCLSDVCRTVCRVASDCGDPCSASNPNGESCVSDVCMPGGGCGGAGPVITAIDGTGDANPGAGQSTAAHFVGSGLRITGTGLQGASVLLRSQGRADQELDVDSSSDTELIACLPPGTAADDYTVVVANQASTTCGDFQLVQGAQGPEGPAGTYTGEQVVGLVNAGLTANSSLSIVGTLSEADGDDRYVNSSGDTMTGELDVYGPLAVGHTSPTADFLVRGLLTTPLTGTVTLTAGNAEVLGTNTKFETELRAGDALLIDGNAYQIAGITNDTDLTLTEVAPANVPGVTATRDGVLVRFQTGAGSDVLRVNHSGTVIVPRALDIGLQRVTDSCTGITCQATAACPAGKKVLSGGCQFSNCPQNGFDYSYPNGTLSGWVCRSNECKTNTAFAICGRVQ